MKIIKIRKKFIYEGFELRIVTTEESYMNAVEPVSMTRVIAPNNGIIPLKIQWKQTLKSIQEDTIIFLDMLKEQGADIESEFKKEITTPTK